jgi:hypothetical protein
VSLVLALVGAPWVTEERYVLKACSFSSGQSLHLMLMIAITFFFLVFIFILL